jgi:hypothetical protein
MIDSGSTVVAGARRADAGRRPVREPGGRKPKPQPVG